MSNGDVYAAKAPRCSHCTGTEPEPLREARRPWPGDCCCCWQEAACSRTREEVEEGGCGVQPGTAAGMELLPDRICQDGLIISKIEL